jgi:hypothetical protein
MTNRIVGSLIFVTTISLVLATCPTPGAQEQPSYDAGQVSGGSLEPNGAPSARSTSEAPNTTEDPDVEHGYGHGIESDHESTGTTDGVNEDGSHESGSSGDGTGTNGGVPSYH